MNAAKLAVRAASWAAALLLTAGASWAGDVVGEAPVPGANAAGQPDERVDLGPGLSDSELAVHSGGADLHLNELKAKALVSENYAGHLVTGNNTISDNAFGNTAGVPMVVQNTGNNVSAQISTILIFNVQ